jgi:hypothetical protein
MCKLLGLVVLLVLAGCSGRGGGLNVRDAPVIPVGQIRLAWNAPTTDSDGAALTDLAGYKLYYGLASRTYTHTIDVGNRTTYTVSSLESGRTYYFAVTAYDTSGNESDFSDEVLMTVSPLVSRRHDINEPRNLAKAVIID